MTYKVLHDSGKGVVVGGGSVSIGLLTREENKNVLMAFPLLYEGQPAGEIVMKVRVIEDNVNRDD